MRYIVGIDPGLSGGIAFYDPLVSNLVTMEMPVLEAGSKSKRVIDELELARMFDDKSASIKKVFIEQVNAMPKQGVTSTFNFGMGFWNIERNY
jgi:crossover junction endodeoxyribonuclease RuvC